MAEYTVSIDNEESSELADAISITGRVNGINVAASVRISAVKKLPTKAQKVSKQKALVTAYLNRQAASPASPGDKVVL